MLNMKTGVYANGWRALSQGVRPVFAGASDPADKPQASEEIQNRTELYQGYLPDCQFLAAILMALRSDSQALSRMIRKNPDGGYIVRFPGVPDAPVQVEGYEITPIPLTEWSRPTQVKAHWEVRLLETAYARLLKQQYPRRFSHIGEYDIRKVIDDPNFDPETFTTAFAYNMLTGRTVDTYVRQELNGGLKEQIREVLSKTNRDLNGFMQSKRHPVSFAEEHFITENYEAIVEKRLKQAAKAPHRFEIAIVTNPNGVKKDWIDWGHQLPTYHVLVVDTVDLKKGQVLLRNPHNSRYGLMVPLPDLIQATFKIYVAEKS